MNYIYFLKRGNKVVYVGRTKNLKNRLSQHKDKIFDNYHYLICRKECASNLEDVFIVKHDPIHNHSLNSCGEYINLTDYCKSNNLSIKGARKAIERTPYINPFFNENYMPYVLHPLEHLIRSEDYE